MRGGRTVSWHFHHTSGTVCSSLKPTLIHLGRMLSILGVLREELRGAAILQLGKGVFWQSWAAACGVRTSEMRLDISWEGHSGAGNRKGEKAELRYTAGAGKVFLLTA